MNEIKIAFFVKHESHGVEIFKRLLNENPTNIVIKKNYVKFCDDWINQKLLTQKKLTKKVFNACINLQKYIVEIEPDIPEHRAKLSNFYAKISNFGQAAEIMRSTLDMDPNNKQYKQLLKKYKKRINS